MDEADVEFEKSTKGINAEWMMVISGGEINVNSASHAIHCQDEIEITDGKFSLSSKYDKGISAHGNLTISGANTVIDVTKSTEGKQIHKTSICAANESIEFGHGGGDFGIIHELYDYLSGNYNGYCAADINISVKNHLIGFAAEKARRLETIGDVDSFFGEYGLINE